MARTRRQTTQAIAWFRDLWVRELMDLEPPYQRRAVWNQSYKDYFVETVLLQYPSPAIFLYEDISADGAATYSVVDGKQRLSAVFEFTTDVFPVSEKSVLSRFRGLYFSQLPDEDRREFWLYQFAVEYLPTTDESTLSNIFDRINRNVARLTPQELRHARFDGPFARKAEDLAEWWNEVLPSDFPRIAPASRRQMKDVELVAQLLLLIEVGIGAYSQEDLDSAYSAREEEWPEAQIVESRFRSVTNLLKDLEPDLINGVGRRLKNQADFYSLFGAYNALLEEENDWLPAPEEATERLGAFMSEVVNEDRRQKEEFAKRYYEAARSASNDSAQRTVRVDIVKSVLTGDWENGLA